jgi:hypothetical protein
MGASGIMKAANDNGNGELISQREIVRRLANIEALLTQLLALRKQTGRAGVKRSDSIRERLRREALAEGGLSEQHKEAARRFLAERR